MEVLELLLGLAANIPSRVISYRSLHIVKTLTDKSRRQRQEHGCSGR